MHALLLTLEAIAFAAGFAIVLTGFGAALTGWALQDRGLDLLLAPAVGLAILALGFQWFTFAVPAYVAAIIVAAVTLPAAAWSLWRRGRALLTDWRDLAGAAAVALGLFVAMIQIDVQRGLFTLAGWPSDNIFIYVQAAQYSMNHAMPSALHPVAFFNPGSDYLTGTGPAFPNSVGPIDAAVALLTLRPVYAVFDSINAVALALTVGPVWFFVRRGLDVSWTAAGAAAVVLATNQLVYWVVGLGFQQESMALPIFATAIAAAARVARAPSLRGGVLLGTLVAALAGLYLPIAVLAAVCAVICAAVAVAKTAAAERPAFVRPLAGAVAAGIVAGIPNLYLLLFRGGLSIWLLDSSVRVPAGGVSRFPFLPYVFGALPFAHGWQAGKLPFGTLDKISFPLYGLASLLIPLLLILGVAHAVRRGRTVEASLLVGGFLFIGYYAVVAQYPYGFVKSIGYMMPLTSAFIALGGIRSAPLSRGLFSDRWRTAGVAAVAVVVLASGLASRDMVKLWVTQPDLPTLPARYLAFADFAAAVPEGKSVFVDYPASRYGDLVKAAAVAYFLPDRDVRVYVGSMRLGTFQQQDQRPQPCAFDYVIAGGSPGSDFTQVFTDPANGLTVYRRDGPACSP